MDRATLRHLLEAVRTGELDVEQGVARLARLPFQPVHRDAHGTPNGDEPIARVDTHRSLRCGFTEVVFGEGKDADELVAIARTLLEADGRLLATRVAPEAAERLVAELPGACHHPRARLVTVGEPVAEAGAGRVLVVSAGTSDGPVAEEALLTARMLGARSELLADVGVAGIHRLLASAERLAGARVLVVVAGMEGALASVVGGLVDRPVIAVPTSVGYGASFGGLAALLAMLSSCAAGVTCVNIDNGFGAGYAAARINAPG